MFIARVSGLRTRLGFANALSVRCVDRRETLNQVNNHSCMFAACFFTICDADSMLTQSLSLLIVRLMFEPGTNKTKHSKYHSINMSVWPYVQALHTAADTLDQAKSSTPDSGITDDTMQHPCGKMTFTPQLSFVGGPNVSRMGSYRCGIVSEAAHPCFAGMPALSTLPLSAPCFDMCPAHTRPMVEAFHALPSTHYQACPLLHVMFVDPLKREFPQIP